MDQRVREKEFEIYESKCSITRTGKFPTFHSGKILSVYINLCPLLQLLLISKTSETCQLQIYEEHDVVSSSFSKIVLANR